MKKTVEAFDELIASVIILIPTWLSMLKSSRILALVGSAIIMYLTATQGGLSDFQTMIVTIIEGLLGISFMGFKTLRPAAVNGNGQVKELKPSAAQPNDAQGASLKSGLKLWDVPLDWTQVGIAIDDLFLQWETYQDYFAFLKLDRFNPAVRLDVTELYTKEGLHRLDKAWKFNIDKFSKDLNVSPPAETDLEGYDAKEDFKTKVNTALRPFGCVRWPEPLNQLVIGYEQMYTTLRQVNLLKGKPIDWEKANTMFDIMSRGLAIVAD